ncbi:HepT-like ribonuclease domain-containing protein [Bradyrhizobium sp. AUGA SZCCT0182]|uniref:HepT-like ribonuclease domain-containing protein n=1 Tax=Bradyrhizobium sp. AUGA SZCCT0182 TaxID=2807667 RepID=UPI0028A2DA3F|nr:HepT-like ribonuclease domain-containing protein [Bradyrhizobium sp. AUGA SZCCT0182]
MARSLIPRLTDIIEVIERVNGVLADVSLEAFENDWQRQWLVERGVEIISEASRHLTDDLKARNPEIPWQKVAGIGNVLRHDYESIAAPVLWKLVQADLPALEKACRSELAAEVRRLSGK